MVINNFSYHLIVNALVRIVHPNITRNGTKINRKSVVEIFQ